MRKIAFPLLLSTLVAVPLCAQADSMKPGLWEITTKMDGIKDMPQYSAADVAQMKKMGIEVPQMNGGGMVNKTCVTPEMAAQEKMPVEQQDECMPKNIRKSGNTQTMDIVCNGPDMKGTGTHKVTYPNSTRFHSVYTFKGTSGGEKVNERHETSGKWLGANCGNVKPLF